MSLNITAKQEITYTGKQVFVHCIYFLELDCSLEKNINE